MLSILIPIFNFDVLPLVNELQRQATNLGIPYEIICIDDGSENTFQNEQLKCLKKVTYLALSKNVGRSRIRNLLAQQAQFEQLLFLDCDSAVLQDDFLKNYMENARPEAIIYGGRNYETHAPTNHAFYFRWWYGVQRETTTANTRMLRPYRSFMTNNFLIPKKVFQKHPLDESIKGYGHEDTLLGIELKKAGVPIIHIDNPLCHIGLETAEEFLQKSESGIKNLGRLIREEKIQEEVKLHSYYQMLQKSGSIKLFLSVVKPLIPKIEKNLKGAKPRLRLFDIWKLYYLSKGM